MATAFRLALALLALLVAATLTLLSSDRALFATAGYLVETLTPYRLVLEAPFLDRSAGRLGAAGVRLYHRQIDGPPLLALAEVEIRDAGSFLFRGDLRDVDLSVANSLFYVDAGDSAADPSPEQWLEQLRWLPRSLELGLLHVIARADTTQVLALRNLRGRWNASGGFELRAAADYDGEPLDLDFELRGPEDDTVFLTARALAPGSASEVRIDGQLHASGEGLSYEATLEADYRQVEEFLKALDDNAYGFAGSLELHGKLAGDLGSADLAIDTLTLDNRPGYRFNAAGNLRWSRGDPVALALTASGELADLGPFAELLGTDLSGLGRLNAELDLDGTLAEPLVQQLQINTRSDSGLAVSLVPTTAGFPLARELPPELAATVTLAGPDASVLDPWVSLPAVPMDSWTLAGTLQRRGEVLSVAGLDLRIEGLPGAVPLEARGSIDQLRFGGGTTPRIDGLDLRLAATGVDLKALLTALTPEMAMPASATLALQARVLGGSAGLRAEAVDATLTTLGGRLKLRGSIGQLLPTAGLMLQADLAGLALAEMTDLIPDYAGPALDGGRVDGQATLTGGIDALSLKTMDLTVAGLALLDLHVTGNAQALPGAPRAQLEASYTVHDEPEARRFAVPPGDGTAVLDLGPERQLVGLHAFLGQSDFTALFDITRADGAITGFSGQLRAPRLHLPDLVRLPESAALMSDEERAGKPGEHPRLPRAPAFPVDLRLEIGRISGTDIAAEDFVIALSGEDRRFILKQFDVGYASGVVQLRGAADLAGEITQLSLAGEALALPVTALATDLGYGGDIEGIVSARGGVTARGNDPEALLASLDGSLAAAIADGYVEGAAFDLLMTDLLRWLLLGGILQNNTNFECAMADFAFEEGIARSESVYLATSNMVAGGKAMLDFPGSRVDIRLDPRARSRTVQIPSSVRIRGPMNGPSIIPSPLTATFDASAKLLFFLPELGMKLLGITPGGKRTAPPCAATPGEP